MTTPNKPIGTKITKADITRQQAIVIQHDGYPFNDIFRKKYQPSV
jgi:hypothetical protein